MNMRFRRLHSNAQTPAYQTPGSVAFDLALIERVVIPPRSIGKARTGISIEVPQDYALIIASRSSNPGKKGVNLANGIGVIDQDYCGPEDELYLILQNITDTPVELEAGMRVAQGMIIPVVRADFFEADALANESRGGIGSTGQ